MDDTEMHDIDCSMVIGASGGFEFTQTIGGRTTELPGAIEQDPLRVLTIQRLERWIRACIGRGPKPGLRPFRCDQTDLVVIGSHLYELLFKTPKVRDTFETSVLSILEKRGQFPARRLRLNIVFEADADELARLPWEFLFVTPRGMDKGLFLAGERIELLLSRKIAPPKRSAAKTTSSFDLPSPQAKDRALRVLLISCSPNRIGDDNFVSLGTAEAKDLKDLLGDVKGLSSGGDKTRFDVSELTNPSYNDVRLAINRFHPHIVHYVGHGKPDHIALKIGNDEDEYDIEHGGDQFRWVTSNEVQALFSNTKPRLVFLNACDTAASVSLDSLKSLAREIVRTDVGGVIAMQYPITNREAATFAKIFYVAISQGLAIDEAVRQGRRELGESSAWGHPKFATPVVYVQNNEPVVELEPSPFPDGTPSNTPPARGPSEQDRGAIPSNPLTA